MTFALYGLLTNEAPQLSYESLAKDLKNQLQNENFSLQREKLPFAKNETLVLKWDKWLARVSFEEGETVRADSLEIQERTKSFNSFDLSRINRRIRVVFGNDDGQQYTNQIIYLMDFLREIRGVVIYDPQQNNFVE
ncbi:hypothetical protein NHH88_16310 [Oxalobacteraceae bacterium OTU3CAMAD1]|nr:hypothetical protein NHH88_16310 [Oxalobacteraceae bacterium OTU3CAMAD1]